MNYRYVMKIVCIVENTTKNEALTAEHGLSLYIETEDKKILFDMGQTELFSVNAEKMKVDLAEVDVAVLSHGHYDHGGGLSKFLSVNSKAPVCLSKYAFGDYYNGCEKYIGLDKSLEKEKRLVFTGDEYRISQNLCLFSKNENERPNYLGSFGLNKLENGVFVPDVFLHEQYLLIEENGKRVLISGCSHKGVMDIVSWFEPDVLVGGFHFSKIEDKSILDKAVSALTSYKTEYYTCHCTGVEQYEYMKEKTNRIHYLFCGDVLYI